RTGSRPSPPVSGGRRWRTSSFASPDGASASELPAADIYGRRATASAARARALAALRDPRLAAKRARVLEGVEGRAAADLLRPALLPRRDGVRARHLPRVGERDPVPRLHRPRPDRLGGDVGGFVRDAL